VDFTLHHFLLPLIDGMEQEGWQVTSVCSDGKYVAPLRERGYRIVTLPIARSFNLFAHAISFWRLLRLFRRERYDVLHAHTPIAALIARLAGRAAGIPLIVYTAHGFYFHDEMPPWKRRLFVTLERLGGRFTDLLFTQSTEDAEAAVTEAICPARNVLAIGNGVDPERFQPDAVLDVGAVKRGLGIPEQAPVIGIIGRMVKEKGYGEFFEAAQTLAGEFPDAYFLQVGGRLESDHDGRVDGILNSAKAALGARLVLAGFRSDTPAMLAAMDVFCLPSYREGMPRTIIEAMMMGKPVVATNIRGAREEVVPGVTGLLVPTRDAHALAEALRRCLANPSEAILMGQGGRRRAQAHYDEKRIVALQINTIQAYLARTMAS
jgi:glycosyltransferase involved in cell wall biosynthesis